MVRPDALFLDHLERTRHNKATETGAELTPEARKMLAEQSAAGDPSALTNVGRGAQGARNIVGIRNEQAASGASGNVNTGTMNAFRAMGVRIDGPDQGRVTVHGTGYRLD